MSPPGNNRIPKVGFRRSWAVLGILARHLWPKGELGLRTRVIVGLVLLILAKITNVYVPILYKYSVDALGEKAQVVAVPIAQPQFAKGFLDDTGLKAVISDDLPPLKKIFPFVSTPAGVALVNGREKMALTQFEDNEPADSLKKLGFVR